jgi:single-strand DNA-binding protein
MTYSRTEIIGRLGGEPEMHYTPSGQPVTNFSVATTHSFSRGDGEDVKETTWFRVVAWGKLAENCKKNLEKGSLVFVEGRLLPDKETGNPRVFEKSNGTWSSTFELNANSVKFLSWKKNGDGAKSKDNGEGRYEYDDVDLPGFMKD